jgi:5-keto 4-deoxyuronate isomerase
MKALILSANNFEDSELLVPFYRLQEAGYANTLPQHLMERRMFYLLLADLAVMAYAIFMQIIKC